jgi:DNA-binding GntR family transcriptional regulator
LGEESYEIVSELLRSGTRYEPGAKISVEELSRELGVSRSPLWGAIARLEADGIVEIVPRLGVYLIKYDAAKALEIYVAREALEGTAAKLAAGQITDKQLLSLQSSIARQRRLLKKGDMDNYATAALGFHEEIADICGNALVTRFLRSIYAQMQAMRFWTHQLPTDQPHTFDDHTHLLEALQARDGKLAEKIAREHVQRLAAKMPKESSTLGPIVRTRGAARPIASLERNKLRSNR